MASKGQQTVVHVTKFNLEHPEQARGRGWREQGGPRRTSLAAAAARIRSAQRAPVKAPSCQLLLTSLT